MKRKNYFIISSVIGIITSLYAIMNANKLAESMMEAMKLFYSSLEDDSINNLFGVINSNYIIIIAIICILLNVLIMYFAIKDKLLRKKGSVIACSILMFFMGTYSITELLAIINIIVMVNSKRVNPEDYPPEKKKMPIIEREEISKRNTIMAIILLAIYFSQFIWADYIKDNKMVISVIFYVGMIILSIVFFKDLFKKNFIEFKRNFKVYFQNLVPVVGKFYLIYLFVAFIAVLLSSEITSVNQENIYALPLWYSLPLAIIYAPLVEETLFRGCIRRFIKNDKLFIVVSALVFGLLHTIFSEETLYNTLVMAIPYSAMGGFLAYLYTKTNNMFCNMSFHCFHNTLAMLLSLLIR